MIKTIKSAFLGVAIGDALGVPVEFLDRDHILRDPVTGMREYGTHHQPVGTFSDDGSLTFCLAEALANGFDLNEIAHNFILWYSKGFWAAHGRVFDIGFATRDAIERLARGVEPQFAGGFEISSNGNGSLMRIMPLLFYIHDKSIEERYAITKQVSSITHGHIRSVISCFYYLEFARHLLKGTDVTYIYSLLKTQITDFLISKDINTNETALFDRLLKGDIYKLPEGDIKSSGYVLHTLEASIWCLMTTANYKDAVLKAVNLGDDTDTTGAVTGGLAGLLYGHETIPAEWLRVLARRTEIENLAERVDKGQTVLRFDFIATIKYKTTAEGGRKTPAHSGYRPQIEFPFEIRTTSGTQIFIDKDFVNPGETVDVAIKMLSPQFFENRLEVGMAFDIVESIPVLATGIITEIINPKLRKL